VTEVSARARWMGRSLLIEVDGTLGEEVTLRAAEEIGHSVKHAVLERVDSARLVLTPMGGGDQPVNLSAGVVQEDWDEGSITWNQQPLSTYEAATARWRPGQSAPVVLDLTDVARAWYACGGTSNNGILISADLASSWVAFGSRKSESPPVLDLVYEQSSSPVNCSAPPVSGISLAPPQVSAPSTTGAPTSPWAAPTST